MTPKESGKAVILEKLLQHRNSLYAYILACVRSHVDADDILQNVSIAVIESEEAPEEDRQFAAWAREITRRRVLEHYRTSRRVVPVDPQFITQLTEAAERADSKHSSQSRREALLACLERLPIESQQLLSARYKDRSTNTSSLAQHFGRTEQGIVSLLYRIRQALRDCVERHVRLEEA